MAVKTQAVKKPRKKSTKTQATKDKEKMAKRLRTGKAGTPKKAKVSKQGGIPFKMKKPTSFGMRSLPETHLTKKGLSLKNLVRSTPRIFINNAIDVEAHRVTKLKTKTGRPTLKGIMWTNDKWRPHKSRRYHETYLIGLDDDQTKPIYRHKRIIAQCDCESYFYTFEYANAMHGAAYLIYSNGDPPDYMNPGYMPGMCKHLIALARICIDKDY